MKKSYLELLKCIFCEEALKISHMVEAFDREIEWGNLDCTGCKNKYPIVAGIPILMGPDAHIDVKKHKIEDNIVKIGPKVKEIVRHIIAGQIYEIEFSLLTPRLRRTTYNKKALKDAVVDNKISRKLPTSLVKMINWNFYYYLKWIFAKFTFEEFRRRKQELKIFHSLKEEKKTSEFLKHYFFQHNKMDEYYFYYRHRFSQPRYLVGISLTNVFEPNKPILDLACGAGHKMHYLTNTRENQKCIGLDRDFVSLYIAKKFIAPKGEYICAEADKPLPLMSDSFSGIYCSDAFQYFTKRSSSVHEMKRITIKEGVIIITRIANSFVYHTEGPEQITPAELFDLFNDMPNVIVGEEMVLKKYIKKLGPDLSSKKAIQELNKIGHLSLVASFNNNIFKDHGSLENWPHAVGNLRLNPLYKEISKDLSGNTSYSYEFPSKWFEFENKDWLYYAPEKITIDAMTLEALSNQSITPEIDKLIDDLVLIGMPNNYF